MDSRSVLKENWLTKKPRYQAFISTSLLIFAVMGLTLLNWSQVFNLQVNRASLSHASGYFKLFTSLFVHGDAGHLVSNLALFIPFAYLLTSYYGLFLFPFLGVLLGGLINLIVLQTMPENIFLIGISGVVNWMGATWLVLFFLIDRRQNRRRRFANVLFCTLVLFVPETYKPEVSYFSHFLGFSFGILTAFIYYYLRKTEFRQADVFEEVVDEDLHQPAAILP